MRLRSEQWWWLGAFCLLSLGIHVGLYLRSHTIIGTPFALSRPTEIEISLAPLPQEKPPALKPAPPAPKPPAQQPPARSRVAAASPAVRAVARAATRRAPVSRRPLPVREAALPEERPVAPAAPLPGGIVPETNRRPLPLGQSLPKVPAPEASAPDDALPPRTIAALPPTAVPVRAPLPPENPLATSAAREERPTSSPVSANLPRIARAGTAVGGSPAPAAGNGGKGGARGPEAPAEDVLFNGGGAGGAKLPRLSPRIGGGGGRATLTVANPLANATIPEEKPGQGPGRGGGAGKGMGGGTGFARGRGVGTDPNGRVALGTLRAKPGAGIGAAGAGNGAGTRAPGGGQGTGSDLPGTGGTGFGYGRGSGAGIALGARPGIGLAGPRGNGEGRGGNAAGRGVPFGDIAGLLRNGGKNGGGGIGGGPGGRGRGSGTGGRAGGGADPVHIVYLLDISGSMDAGDKIGKAKTEMKRTLAELKPRDSFNIIAFSRQTYSFSASLVSARAETVRQALEYVDALKTSPDTNMSGAFEVAFARDEKITQIFLLSDGEPHTGIENFDELRRMVRERNRQHARISTLALGLGEQFPGIVLLKGIAEDNNGQFGYVNLAR